MFSQYYMYNYWGTFLEHYQYDCVSLSLPPGVTLSS